MTQPEPQANEPGKMNESPIERLKRSAGKAVPPKKEVVPMVVPEMPEPIPEPNVEFKEDKKPVRREFKFLPAFWTIASVMSLAVNIVLLLVLVVLLQNLKSVGVTTMGLTDQLLGGLYNNFVKMDNATIKTQIPVNANVPLNIIVPVRATTQISLAEAAVIRNAHVVINTSTLNIDANATVTLPKDTPLTVNLDFPLQVTDAIPVSLLVDVNIPLKNTELSDPFNGLQDVVRPYYCLINPDATSIIDNSFVCSQNP